MSNRHYSYVLGYTEAKFRTCKTDVIKNICALHIITSYQYDSFFKKPISHQGIFVRKAPLAQPLQLT